MSEEKSEEHSAGNSGDGNQSETTDLIDRANKTAERVEASNREARAILEEQKALFARAVLGGRSVAGQKTKSQEEVDAESAAEIVKRYTARR